MLSEGRVGTLKLPNPLIRGEIVLLNIVLGDNSGQLGYSRSPWMVSSAPGHPFGSFASSHGHCREKPPKCWSSVLMLDALPRLRR
jgi:hypothetical protein